MKNNGILDRVGWLFYTVFAGGSFLTVMLAGITRPGDGRVIAVSAAVGLFLLAGLIVFSLRKLLHGRTAKEDGERKLVLVIAESILFILCLTGMLTVRILAVSHVPENHFFEASAVSAGQQAVFTGSGGVDLYVRLLHVVLFVFGNKVAAAAGLQVVLQMAAGILLYYAVRRLSGPVAALITLAFFGFSHYLLQETMLLSPLPLFLMISSLTLWMTTGLGKQKPAFLAVFHCLLTGVLAGLCCYLDLAGVTALIFLLWQILLCGKKKGVFCILSLVSAEISFLGMQALAGLSAGRGLLQTLELWMLERVPGYFQVPAAVNGRQASGDVMLLTYLLIIGIFSFYRCPMRKSYGMWLFAAVILAGMQCFGMTGEEPVNSFVLLYLFCTVLAGNAVGALFGEKIPAPVTGNEEEQTEETVMEEKKMEKQGGEELKRETGRQIQYIENPLPLPKKSTKKALDYDYEVSDDDDFDI